MLKGKWYIALISVLVMFSCGKDEEGTGVNFKDQNLQGEVDGTSWILTDGYAEADGDNNELYIVLIDATGADATSPCELSFQGYTELFFTIQMEVGTYNLKFDFSDLEGSQTATFYVSDGNMNYIATEGAIEITSVTETGVTGRMDIRSSDNTFANGNFTIEYCI